MLLADQAAFAVLDLGAAELISMLRAVMPAADRAALVPAVLGAAELTPRLSVVMLVADQAVTVRPVIGVRLAALQPLVLRAAIYAPPVIIVRRTLVLNKLVCREPIILIRARPVQPLASLALKIHGAEPELPIIRLVLPELVRTVRQAEHHKVVVIRRD